MVQNVGIENRCVYQLPAELIALDVILPPLNAWEIQLDIGGDKNKLSAFSVLFHFPAFRCEWLGVAVDDDTQFGINILSSFYCIKNN